ncbi:MAG TPA: hypothetical protein VMM38_13320 [Aridibacter sp.]|nr:hypothetical protein [Aridibacter sp.]
MLCLLALPLAGIFGQSPVKPDPQTEKAEEVIAKAAAKLGGQAYLNAQNSVGEGNLSLLQQGKIGSYMSFVDVIVFPDRERTDFEERGSKTVQVNTGETGWIYEEHLERFGDQTELQIDGFKRAIRTHFDHLLRGVWKGDAELSYIGRRPSTPGKRNDVVRLDFGDGFWTEYEFDDEGLPMKTIFATAGPDDTLLTEENRYGRYVSTGGILYPSVVDRFRNDVHIYRATYESMEFNKRIPDEIFVKPEDPKKLRKKLKI